MLMKLLTECSAIVLRWTAGRDVGTNARYVKGCWHVVANMDGVDLGVWR